MPPIASANSETAHSTRTFSGSLPNRGMATSMRKRMRSGSRSVKTKMNSVRCRRSKYVCLSSVFSAMMGEPSWPPTYSPGPQNPSMKRTRVCQDPRDGNHPARYSSSIKCLASVCGSASQIVVLGAMHRFSAKTALRPAPLSRNADQSREVERRDRFTSPPPRTVMLGLGVDRT
jgi:hypothetical protein